ncbi:MAG: hypothetical protein IT425_00490 [Pirellulales bacterium]|nr:hypothetical protein [Pirellulales bacterium]
MFDEHESAEFELTPDLAAIERQLARLTPAAPRIDRDRLMFAAGKAAATASQLHCEAEPSPNPSLQGSGIKAAATLRVAGPRGWFWPAATATMTAATLLLATMLVWQRTGQPIAANDKTLPNSAPEATRTSTQPAAPTSFATTGSTEPETIGWPFSPPPTAGYLGLRYIALTRGVDTLSLRDDMASFDSDTPEHVPATQRELLRELLPSADRTASPSS